MTAQTSGHGCDYPNSHEGFPCNHPAPTDGPVGIHYDDCPRAYDGHRDEAAQADCVVCEAIDAHGPCAMQHDIFIDDPMDSQGPCEPILWCETCSITVMYMDSLERGF